MLVSVAIQISDEDLLTSLDQKITGSALRHQHPTVINLETHAFDTA